MVNRIDSGRDTKVVVTVHEGLADCHIACEANEIPSDIVAETTMESHRRAAEVCADFQSCWHAHQDPLKIFRKVTMEVAGRYNGI